MSFVDHGVGQASAASAAAPARIGSASVSGSMVEPGKIPTAWIVVMAVISAILVPSRMLLSTGESDDSSVFAYIGWAMKHGLMPYRDIWDHKGPLLYYLQFAGISLQPNSTLGIGLLELLALSITFFLLYRVITSFTSLPIGLGIGMLSVIFVTHFSAGGNMCESWALLPLAAAHYVCWRWSTNWSQNWCAPALSVCVSGIFWLRPNMAVFPVVAMLVMLHTSKRQEGTRTAIRQLALAGAAALAITVLILAPLYRFGVFREFVEAYFAYNAAYSSALSLGIRVLHTRELLAQLFAAGIAILGTAACAFAFKERKQIKTGIGRVPTLYLQTLLWSLPFEIAAATLSGRDYLHYVLPLLPTFAILAAWFLAAIEETTKVRAGKPVLATALLLGLCPFSFAGYANDLLESSKVPRPEYVAVIHFIQHATSADDKIVVVGGTESGYISFRAQRLPASRFVYQYPLIDTANPTAFDQRREFLCELAANRPAVIVSGNKLLGILCASALECSQRNSEPPASDYGYDSKVLPQLFKAVLASEYKSISDPRFGYMQVYLRKDIRVPSQW